MLWYPLFLSDACVKRLDLCSEFDAMIMILAKCGVNGRDDGSGCSERPGGPNKNHAELFFRSVRPLMWTDMCVYGECGVTGDPNGCCEEKEGPGDDRLQ